MSFHRRALLAAVLAIPLLAGLPAKAADTNGILVLGSDFGLKDSAVATMKGVALTVDRGLTIHDLTHDITAFDIWSMAYQLGDSFLYWPSGTVFVVVVDPGVGTERGAVVAQLKSGQYIVAPDNGLLTFVDEKSGVQAVRRIDETINRLPGSSNSYTFHGRDIFAYTGARLASGKIAFADVGPLLDGPPNRIEYQKPVAENGVVRGIVPSLDINFGNVWTNIPQATLESLGVKKGDQLTVTIAGEGTTLFQGTLPYVDTFGDVPEGQPLAYIASNEALAFAINYGNFSEAHAIPAGSATTVTVTKL